MPDNNHASVIIIILNWNNWRDTIACVESCQKLTYSNHRIVLIDNGSTDGSEKILTERFPYIEIIQTGSNLGFAGGNNVGIRHAIEGGADYVWLLNNDAVVDPLALTALVDALENDPHATIAGSKIFYHDEPRKIWFAGGTWSKGRLRLRQRGASHQDEGQFDKLCAVGSVSGCSLLISAKAINKIGLMDEDYFLYWEDTDWCARASNSGYTILFVPASQVWHKISKTVKAHSELQYYYVTRNGIRFCCRHDLLSLPVFLCYVTIDVLCGCLRGNFVKLSGYSRGIIDFLGGKSGQIQV
jgi:GT2 family glycosyltransferase